MKRKICFSIILLFYVFCTIYTQGRNSESKQIDSKVIPVMEDIGWSTVQGNSLVIKSNDINATTGIGNVHNSYSFYAESPYPLTNYLWTYKIRKNDNSFETIATGSSPTFSIDPLTISDNYYRTEHGDFSGIITLQSTANEVPVTADFNIWLEASPTDIEYEVKIIKVSEWYYNLEVIVYSAGATDITVTLNDYAIGESLTTIFYDHQYVKYTYGHLYYDSPILIEFSSENSYGTKNSSYYSEGVLYTGLNPLNKNVKKYDTIDRKEIYSITGHLKLILAADRSINSTDLMPGIYILKTIYKDGSSSCEKFVKKQE